MGVFSENAIIGASAAGGYDIDQSLRIDDGDSAYLSRTAGTATSNDIGTLSFWTKRGNLGGGNSFFSNHADSSNRTYVGFDADKITMFGKISNSTNVELLTTQVFRDPSAWYHIVIAVDVTQATSTNRVKIYVNGSQITSFSTATYPAQNTDLPLFSKTNHQVGAFFSSSVGDYYDGYLAEFHYIDGQQLAPASFGETNSATNQWQAIEYDGSYGSNGYYLKFGGEGFLTYDREAEIAVTSSFTWAFSSSGNTSGEDLVNGLLTNNDAGGGWMPAGNAADRWIKFDFVTGKVYKACQWISINSTGSEGTWKWQGSNNDASWTDIGGTFTLGGSDGGSNVTYNLGGTLNANTTSYRYYRILGISGTVNTSGRRLAMYFSETVYGLGGDSSGQGNSFTTTNLEWSDQVLDSPTNNFATINGLTESIANRNDFFEGNLRAKANDISGNSSAWFTATIGIPPNTGKYYWEFCDEVYIDAGSFGGAYPDGWGMGMIADDGHTNMMADTDIGNTGWWFSKSNNNVGTARARGGGTSSENKRVPSTSTGVFKCCYDSDAGSFWFGGDLGWMTKTSTGTPETSAQPGSGNDLWDSGTGTGFAGYTVVPAWATINAGGNLSQLRFNFGQDSTFAGLRSGVSGTAGNPGGGGYGGNADTNAVGDFFYEVPTGFKALCSDNLPDPAIALPTAHFNTATYAGTGASQTIAVGFQPDFVWAKSRNTAVNNVLYDSVRGTGRLESNNTNAEGTRDGFAGYSSNGFDVDDDGGGGGINYPSGRTYVGWAWKAGGAASSNSDGSITSSVSANTTAGFSIVGWTGTGSNATVGHGLSQAPELVINKSRSQGNVYTGWTVYSKPTWVSTSNTNLLYLNTDAAEADDTNIWQDAPTASLIQPQGGAWAGIGVNGENYIAYCFHSVNGYSKVGKYEGNANANGQFVYTGFRPAWLLIKKYDGTEDWIILDNKRDSYNVVRNGLYADLNNAEGASDKMDFTSNGFKIRSTTGVINSSANFLYIAFAESPFKTANAR